MANRFCVYSIFGYGAQKAKTKPLDSRLDEGALLLIMHHAFIHFISSQFALKLFQVINPHNSKSCCCSASKSSVFVLGGHSDGALTYFSDSGWLMYKSFFCALLNAFFSMAILLVRLEA